MPWAARRKLIIMIIVCAFIVAFVATVLISVLYKTPTCSDNVRNQGEIGVDCGGPCPYLCSSQVLPPTVIFSKALDNGLGRIDLIASVQNKNLTAGAKDVPYHVTLYSSDQSLIREFDGTLDLPAGATVPVYIPSVATVRQKVIGAFLTIADFAPRWFNMTTDQRAVPTVVQTVRGGSINAPLVQAVLANQSGGALSNVQVIVFVHNTSSDVIAASQTIVPSISAQGRAVASFTWNSRFSDTPASIEVVPIIPLP